MYKQYTLLNYSFNSICEIEKLNIHPFDNLKLIKKKIEEHNVKVIDKSIFYKHLFLEIDHNKSLIEFISEENNKVKNDVIVYFLEKWNFGHASYWNQSDFSGAPNVFFSLSLR